MQQIVADLIKIPSNKTMLMPKKNTNIFYINLINLISIAHYQCKNKLITVVCITTWWNCNVINHNNNGALILLSLYFYFNCLLIETYLVVVVVHYIFSPAKNMRKMRIKKIWLTIAVAVFLSLQVSTTTFNNLLHFIWLKI